jgi:hypothetical protein
LISKVNLEVNHIVADFLDSDLKSLGGAHLVNFGFETSLATLTGKTGLLAPDALLLAPISA